MKRIILLACVALLVMGSDMPPVAYFNQPLGTPEVLYWPEMWKQGQGYANFQLGYWHKDNFNISWTVLNSEPEIGYPYHYGLEKGINDTIKVRVYFDNRSSSDFAIASQSPENWFYPVFYNPFDDVFKRQPMADTSAFSYRAERWINMLDGTTIAKPDTFYSRALHQNVHPSGLILSIWNVSPGSFRIILKPTANLPSYIHLTLDNPNNVAHIVKGQNTLDTLNAFAMIACNALLRREYTLFNRAVGSMFAINPQCLPGWALRYEGYMSLADTASAIIAIDWILYIGKNNLDPCIPDSSKRTIFNDAWLENYMHNYPFARWRLMFPDYARYIVFE